MTPHQTHPKFEALLDSVDLVEITVVGGPLAGRSFRGRPPIDIGSSPNRDFVLPDPLVSRSHARLERHGPRLVLCDADSTNGMWVGGARVRELEVGPGCQVRLGNSLLEFEAVRTEDDDDSVVEVGGLRAHTDAMKVFLYCLRKVAPTALPVLIEGETGSGKERVARAIHDLSGDPERPFVVVDCGATSASLIEATLFGHERGAFTGADEARPGAFVAANGGTIFLDEIGDLPLELQPKLLRALEMQTVQPLGSQRQVPFQARILAATHQKLSSMVQAHQFREDLYFRLAVFPLRVPALRDRPNCIGPLAEEMLHETLAARGWTGPLPRLDAATKRWLRAQAWPGNVRELRNVIQRASVMSSDEHLQRGCLLSPDKLAPMPPLTKEAETVGGLREARRAFERTYLRSMIDKCGGDRAAAAAAAKVHPKTLQRLLRED